MLTRHQLGARLCCLFLVTLLGCDSRTQATNEAIGAGNSRAEAGVDAAIVTVIAAEYDAVLRHMDRTYPLSTSDVNAFAWVGAELDRAGGQRPLRLVVGMAGEAGTTSGALAVYGSAVRWDPGVLILAGIAGGLEPAVKRGDVVVSRSVWGYEYGSIDATFNPRFDWTFQPHPGLVEAALAYTGPWQNEIVAEKPVADVSPALRTGLTASGNKVIETQDSVFARTILGLAPDTASVEMEAAGAFAAAELLAETSTPVLMVRGISDIPNPRSEVLGDKRDRERWKQYAADSMAAFTTSFLRDGLPPRPEPLSHDVDALVVTYTDAYLSALASRLGAAAPSVDDSELRLQVSTGSDPVSVVVAKLDNRDDAGNIAEVVDRTRPRSLLLVDCGVGLPPMNVGDVVAGRLVWSFEKRAGEIVGDLPNARRASRSLVAAAQAIERTGVGDATYQLKSTTIAAGETLPAWDDTDTFRGIAALNGRTGIVDDESLVVVEWLFGRRKHTDVPSFLSIQSACRVAGSEERDDERAANNAADVTANLIELRWPY